MARFIGPLLVLGLATAGVVSIVHGGAPDESVSTLPNAAKLSAFDRRIAKHAIELFEQGRATFRSDTFGDEAFWGGKLQLHKAIAGERLGGVGAGITPTQALALGLKVDVDALPGATIRGIQQGRVKLDNPATTLTLLRLNAVVGLKGVFAGERLDSIGITCALCHSTVDNSLTFGIGHRLDGWANRDLDVGRIVAASPDLTPFTSLLGVDIATVKTVLLSWGPGKFDAQLLLDGKAFNTRQVTDGVVTSTMVSGATLIPMHSVSRDSISTRGPAPGALSRTGMHSLRISRCTGRADSSIRD